jgi:hypothetical protein
MPPPRQVETADDGDVALAWLCNSYAPGGAPVDLVLMDMQARPFVGCISRRVACLPAAC